MAGACSGGFTGKMPRENTRRADSGGSCANNAIRSAQGKAHHLPKVTLRIGSSPLRKAGLRAAELRPQRQQVVAIGRSGSKELSGFHEQQRLQDDRVRGAR